MSTPLNQERISLRCQSLEIKEDPPMTMQVGMVGTDGILLASDTRMYAEIFLRHSFDGFKITISQERGIAISAAHEMRTARTVADAIISELKDEEMNSPIASIQKITSKICESDGDKNRVECLIALAKPLPRLFHLQYGPNLDLFDLEKPGVWCEQILTKCHAGDKTNPAMYLMERYYRKIEIGKLVPLAAQVIITAHILNTGGVDGLDIVLCNSSGIRRLSDDSVRELESKANDLEKHIEDLFLNHEQILTFVSNPGGGYRER